MEINTNSLDKLFLLTNTYAHTSSARKTNRRKVKCYPTVGGLLLPIDSISLFLFLFTSFVDMCVRSFVVKHVRKHSQKWERGNDSSSILECNGMYLVETCRICFALIHSRLISTGYQNIQHTNSTSITYIM